MIFPAVPLLLLDFSIQTQLIRPRWLYLPFQLRIPADIKKRKILPLYKNKNFSMPKNYLWCEKYVVFGLFFFYRKIDKSKNQEICFQTERRKKKTFVETKKIYLETCAGALARWTLEFKWKMMNYKRLAEL